MYLIAIAWMYTVVVLAAAEWMAPNGTGLGAFFTLVLYGLLPLSVVLYIFGTPARRRARRLREQPAPPSGEVGPPDAASAPEAAPSGHAPPPPSTQSPS